MRSIIYHILILLIFQFPLSLLAQSITLNRGYQELKIGSNDDQVEEFVGFRGKQIDVSTFKEFFIFDADALALLDFIPGFDYCLVYKHIMPIPVTKIFFKKGKVVGIEINSYPDFTRPICLDSETSKGLKFWDSSEEMTRIYGTHDNKIEPGGENLFYTFPKDKMAFGLSNDEVRIIYYY
ncbi:hypothetical protein ACFLU5_00370 [Bacteroidota bacterium]